MVKIFHSHYLKAINLYYKYKSYNSIHEHAIHIIASIKPTNNCLNTTDNIKYDIKWFVATPTISANISVNDDTYVYRNNAIYIWYIYLYMLCICICIIGKT